MAKAYKIGRQKSIRNFLPEIPPQRKSREAEWQAAGEMERRIIALEEQVAFLLREVYSLSKRSIPARVDRKNIKERAS